MIELKAELENSLKEAILTPIDGSGRIETFSGTSYFLKTGSPSGAYRNEASGLAEIARHKIIRTPEVIAVGDNYLLTRYIQQSSPPKDFFERFGRALAHLHRVEGESFGFYEDNYIGGMPQINRAEGDEKSNWVEFYHNRRLRYQYRLAQQRGLISSSFAHKFELLENKLPAILKSDSPPQASLLHGDLWAGNFLCDIEGEPVLIDPAVYYGDRESDLAMTRLFGGFTETFYRSYNDEYPLEEGYRERERLYKLYHLMNHMNLFGGGYRRQAEQVLDSYL